jgi:hypothetical protein
MLDTTLTCGCLDERLLAALAACLGLCEADLLDSRFASRYLYAEVYLSVCMCGDAVVSTRHAQLLAVCGRVRRRRSPGVSRRLAAWCLVRVCLVQVATQRVYWLIMGYSLCL